MIPLNNLVPYFARYIKRERETISHYVFTEEQETVEWHVFTPFG